MSIILDRDNLKGFLEKNDFDHILPQIKKAHEAMEKKSSLGKEYLGWIDLPSRIEDKLIKDLNRLAQEVQQSSDALISIGIGGSYLGIRATIDLAGKSKLPVYYAGHNLSSDYLYDLLETVKNKRLT